MNTVLPIYPYKDEIVSAVVNNDTVILTAETGSGKSTQVPQYLYKAGYNVIVTQPRRIACVTLADRVSKEMNGVESEAVGYQTAFESTRTENTRVLFCTDGLQLARGIKDNKSILIIDELHEWNLNIETLVAWIKKYRQDGGQLKVVLMSATMDVEELKEFYSGIGSVVTISIPGRLFKVEEKYITDYSYENEYYKLIITSLSQGKNVLAFRPGKKEISDTIDRVEKLLRELQLNVKILPMHGELPIDEQNKCFVRYPIPKIVVSTNIAQTSVTIPDINVVIDDGLEKRIQVSNGIESLVYNAISQADIKQRAGRAGRVSEGEYYLCSNFKFEDRDEYSLPEINRLLLDKVVLKLYSVGIDAEEIEFYHQPDKESLVEAKNLLKLLGAIDETGITTLGRSLIQYPVSVRSSKIIETAKQYPAMMDDIIKIVSIIENNSLVNFKHEVPNFIGTRNIGYSDFTEEDRSDLLAELDILNKILNYEIEDLIKAGINKKSFIRIKEFYTKLKEYIKYDENGVTSNRDEQYYKNLLKCVYAGNIDRIFVGCWGSYTGITNTYKGSRNSCVEMTRVVLGYPKTIHYKNKWGSEVSLNLIDNISSIPDEFLLELLDHSKLEIKESEPEYSYYGEKFIIYNEITYMDSIHFKVSFRTIEEDDPEFAELKRQHDFKYGYEDEDDWEVETTRNQYITINGEKKLLTYGNDGRYHQYFYKYTQIPSAFDKVEVDKNLDIVYHCNELSATDISTLRQKVFEHDIEIYNKQQRKDRKIKKVKTLEILEEEYLSVSKLGFFPLKDEVGGITCHWYGLTLENDEVKTKIFDLKEEYESNTVSSLQRLFRKWVNANYSSSTFVINSRGRQITNKSTEEAKEIFKDYLNEIVHALNFVNLQESKEYIASVYQECIDMMEENPW